MVLDLENINMRAPYRVTNAEMPGYFGFVTVHGVEYRVGFSLDDLITSGETYQFDITNVNHRPSPNDSDVRRTITVIVEEFFLQNTHALLYICETGDGKQAMRSRLFHGWVNAANEHKERLVLIETEIIDEEGVRNYAALLVPKDNPNFSEIITEFTTTAQLLQEKPNQ